MAYYFLLPVPLMAMMYQKSFFGILPQQYRNSHEMWGGLAGAAWQGIRPGIHLVLVVCTPSTLVFHSFVSWIDILVRTVS